MDTPLISVIVPVYKVEAYLKRCVDSIRNQTYQNLEIILVDDGSPDRCGEMCDAFAKEDPRIVVIHKENGGLSSARNAGLDAMTGEYVGFADSDDWIEPEMFETLYRILKEHNAQIAECGIQCDFPDGRKVYFDPDYPNQQGTFVYSKLEAIRDVTYNQKIANASWNKLYSRHVFDKLRFRVGWYYEDYLLMPSCMDGIETLVYNTTPMYHYVMTPNSITRAAIGAKQFQEADVSREVMAFYQKNYPQFYDHALARHLRICMFLILYSDGVKACADLRKQALQDLRKMANRQAFRLLDKKDKIRFLLCFLNAKLFVICSRMYQRGKLRRGV